MSDLVVIAFPTEAKAEEVRQKLLAMQKEYLIELGDAVIAVKDSEGHIKLNQLINTTAAGAVTGAFWGTLIGLIFLMPLAGAALGAASGTLGGYLTDVGLNDKWMKETAAAVQPGTAALFVLVRKVTADKVLERLKGEGGTVLKTSLDHTKEAALQAALAEVKRPLRLLICRRLKRYTTACRTTSLTIYDWDVVLAHGRIVSSVTATIYYIPLVTLNRCGRAFPPQTTPSEDPSLTDPFGPR